MRQAVDMVSHYHQDISALEKGKGDQDGISGRKVSGGGEGTVENAVKDDVIQETTVTDEKMKEEENVISMAEMRKEADVREEEGVMEEERLICAAAVKEHAEVDQAVTEVAAKIGEEVQREEENPIHEFDMRGKKCVREEEIVNLLIRHQARLPSLREWTPLG